MPFFAFLASLFLFASCTKPTINFGTPFANDNTTNIVVVDTFTTWLSTVSVDSFLTGGTGSILVGKSRDEYTGTTLSKSYFQVAPPFTLPNISNQAGYDSIALILFVNGKFYGDTSLPQQYNIHQLSQVMQFPGNQTVMFNNDSFPYQSTPLGSTTATIYPTAKFTSQLIRDTMRIRLSDALGKQLFRMLWSKSDTLTNTSSFLAFFKGLVMTPGTPNGTLYGFKDSVLMRVYYHEPGVVLTPEFTDFSIYNKAFQFNQINYDHSGSPLAPLDNQQPAQPGVPVEVSSTQTGNAAYIQGASPLQIKLRFPYLWKLKQLPDFLTILRADLILKPLAGSYSPQFALAPRLSLFTTDDRNQAGVPVSGSAYGNLVVDYVYGQNTAYTFDITNYLKSQLLVTPDLNLINGLLIDMPSPDANTIFNRTALGDRNNPNPLSQIQLRIYYASYINASSN